jgi:hypothetical protein
MRITKKVLQEQFSKTELEKFVLRDILEEAKDYSGTWTERLKGRLNDICQNGCVSGTVSGLIYHTDCKKFFIRFIDDISEVVIDLEANMGLPLANKQQQPIYTFYAWLAYEEVAYQISNFIDENC